MEELSPYQNKELSNATPKQLIEKAFEMIRNDTCDKLQIVLDIYQKKTNSPTPILADDFRKNYQHKKKSFVHKMKRNREINDKL